MYPTRMGGCALLSISCMFSTKSETVFLPFNPRSGDRMRRAVGLGLLVLAATPVTLVAQAADSLAQAANTAAAANTVAINFVWTLVAGFLVMFMQAGFAMVETGFTRAKNAAHTMTMNFMVYGIAMLAYWAVAFAIQAGGVGALGTLGGFDKLAHEFSLTIAGKQWGLFGRVRVVPFAVWAYATVDAYTLLLQARA